MECLTKMDCYKCEHGSVCLFKDRLEDLISESNCLKKNSEALGKIFHTVSQVCTQYKEG